MTRIEENLKPEDRHIVLGGTYRYYVKGTIIGPYFLSALLLVFQTARWTDCDFERAHYSYMKKVGLGYSAFALGAYGLYSAQGEPHHLAWLFIFLSSWALLIAFGALGRHRFRLGLPPPF